MGRWVSTIIQGKHGIKTRIVSVYVPILMSKHGHKKVACQQQRALLAMGITGNVLDIFWRDLWKDIDQWIEAGEQLIVAGDWNTNVTKEKFLEEFERRNLIPAIATVHGKNLPPTHNNGSVPIDEIFVSRTININAAGYLEHGSTLSDHRPIWIDVTKQSLIGTKSKLSPTFAARKLKTNDPRIVNNYLNKLHSLLNENKVVQRAERLARWVNGPLSQAQIEEYEELDRLKTKAMEAAEKGCRKLKMGEVKWSPQLQIARDRIRYYTLSRRKLLGRRVRSSLLTRLSKKVSRIATHLDLSQIEEKIDESYKAYKKLRKNHEKLRESFIEDLAAALKKKGKGKRANIVKQLIATESQREMFRRLAIINNKQHDLSTKFVTINTKNGKEVISDKIQMEKAIINENKSKYHQTEDSCPFMDLPLSQHFGEMGIGPMTEQLLKGEYKVPSSVTPQTKEYLELCRLPSEELYINPMTRSLEYFQKSWRKMKERTASRSIHFGHFKAATENDDVMRCHYSMAEIPFRSGYSPERWKKATNIMILKKEGVNDLDRLRTLVLFEADFNHNNKFFGRDMMNHMMDTNQIAQEQYSAPGRKCIDQVLNRRLYFDLIRYQKTSAAMAAADLKSCYDRVAHAPAYLAMRSFGMPTEPIQSMLSTLQDIQYYTFTSHGVSDLSFGGKERGYKAKPNGLGQGNGAGPSIWSIVSSKMFQVMNNRDATTTITSPISKEEIEACGFAFVDDTDLIAMSEGINTHQDAQQKMQKVIDEWEAVSKTTGGALVPKKCWCWLISFDWRQDQWKYSDNSKKNITMTVKNEKEEKKSLTLLPPNKAKEMLGVNLAPDGNQDEQIRIIKEKMTTYAEYIRVGHVNRYEAWTSLSMIAMKSLEYLLPAMTLSAEECTSIMKPVLKQFLPKAGLNRNIKRDLLYSPVSTQGLNLRSPFITQGVSHVKDITENIWKNTITGKLIKCNLEQLRIEIGQNISILESNYEENASLILTDSYVSSTWKFMSQFDITLKDGTPKVPFLRQKDKCIMEVFLDDPEIDKSWIPTLNRCRLYLKAFTLSDITTGCGLKIREEAWHGIKYDTGRNTSQWPIWGKPALLSWTKWRTALRSSLCANYNRILNVPLGNWIQIPLEWKWFTTWHRQKKVLIKKENDQIYLYNRVGRSELHKRFSDQRKKVKIPNGKVIIPTTVRKQGNYWIMSNSPGIDIVEKENTNHENKDGISWLNIQPFSKGAQSSIKRAIENNTAIAVSDGSYSEILGLGTASWIISTQNKEHLLTAGALAPGGKSIQSSYRSEILGLLGILEALHHFCLKWKITEGSCVIMCDGISALEKVEELTRSQINTRHCSCDLLSACVGLKETLPIKLRFAHVKGHQDNSVPLHKLSLAAQHNVLMDRIAKNMLKDYTLDDARNLVPHHLSIISPKHKDKYILQDYKRELYDSLMEVKAHTYWTKDKNRYKEKDVGNIDWEAQTAAMKTIRTTKQRTLVKWFSGWVGVGKNMERWNLRFKGHCPFCNYPKETTQHVIMCKHAQPTDKWKTLLQNYDTSLIRLITNYYLRKAIIYELWAWRRKDLKPLPTLLYADQDLKEAIMEQRSLGWKVYLEGLISTKITQYQQAYHKNSSKQQTTFTWPKKVVKCGWKILTEMWDHRNKKLHQTDVIEDMEGIQILNKILTKERDIGLNKLPMLEYSHLFRLSENELLNKSTEGKKDWLVTVKLARELHNDTNKQEDETDTNDTIRAWIGLPKKT